MIKLINIFFLYYLRGKNKLRKLNNKNSILLSSKYILEKNYKKNGKFTFIQVGANDGVSFDYLFDFVNERNSYGVVVEPVKEYFDELVKNYHHNPNIIKINKAIHDSDKSIVIYKIKAESKTKYPDWVKGIASLDKNHHKTLGINSEDIISEIVETQEFNHLVMECCLQNKVNYLQIDTEGFDYNILKMIDFEIMYPEIIKYESINLSNANKTNAELLLEGKNYYMFNENGDTIALQLNKVRLF